MKEALDWVLYLEPKIDHGRTFTLDIHVVGSEGIAWKSKEAYNQRVHHELAGAHQLREHAKTIRHIDDFQAWYLIGGHEGMFKFMGREYTANSAAGW